MIRVRLNRLGLRLWIELGFRVEVIRNRVRVEALDRVRVED